MNVYHHDWEQDGEAQMLADFGVGKEVLEGATVLCASYSYEDYSGDAYVLFERDGKLFEIHGGHCSCYGLSESSYSGNTTTQWQPEEIDKDSILHRIEKGTWGEEGQMKSFVIAALEKHGGAS